MLFYKGLLIGEGIMTKGIQDVQPIRSLEKIEDMKWSLKRHCSERDYIMFLLGINTGLRVSDLLALKIKDVKGKKKMLVGKEKQKRSVKYI